MLVGGATPGDPAAPVPATITPASPTPDKTRQPNIYGSLASKQHFAVLYGDPLPSSLVPPTPPGAPPPGTFPDIGPPALNHGTIFTQADRLYSKPILSPHGIPLPSPGATSQVHIHSVKHGCFQSQFSSHFVVQSPTRPRINNCLL